MCLVSQDSRGRRATSADEAFAADPEHMGDELLRHRQFVGVQPLKRQQQPAAQPLVHRVMAVADGGLCHLRTQGRV